MGAIMNFIKVAVNIIMHSVRVNPKFCVKSLRDLQNDV